VPAPLQWRGTWRRFRIPRLGRVAQDAVVGARASPPCVLVVARELIPYFRDVVRILAAVPGTVELLSGPDIEVFDNQIGRLSVGFSYDDGSRLYVRLDANCSGEQI